MSKPTLYKIEAQFSYGWGDAGWMEDNDPMRFKTKVEATQAIMEFIQDAAYAFKKGYSDSKYKRSEFRIVPA